MTDKQRTLILFGLLVLSVILQVYVKTHIGEGFVRQLSR